MNISLLIFHSKRRDGHWPNYRVVLDRVCQPSITVTSRAKMYYTNFGYQRLIITDGDSEVLFSLPIILIRCLIKKKTILLSIRSDSLLANTKAGNVRKALFAACKCFKAIQVVSIAKGEIYESTFSKWYTEAIYDLQLWDLPILKVKPKKITLLPGKSLLVVGRINDEKSERDLKEFLGCQTVFDCIFLTDFDFYNRNKDIFLNIMSNSSIDDATLLGLYESCTVIYCFYSNDNYRPSGVFGRAVQLLKPVIIRRHGFLDRNYQQYSRCIAVQTLLEEDEIVQRLEVIQNMSLDKKCFNSSSYNELKRIASVG